MGKVSASNRWRGGDTDENRSCSVCPVNRLECRGEQDDRGGWRGGDEELGKSRGKNIIKRGGGKESENKAVAGKQEFIGSVA